MKQDRFSEKVQKLYEENLVRTVKDFDDVKGSYLIKNGKTYAVFCSNDYLGLKDHPHIINAFKEGVDKYGAGSGASRLVSGSLTPHARLETALRDYMGVPATLLFNSGYSANSGIIPAVTGRGEVILADRLNHASLVDGCRLSRAEFKRYPHVDMDALEKLLQKYQKASARWIITDGVFSMDGDIAPLPEICELAQKYDAYVYLDDAHAFGVLGDNGRGSAELAGVADRIDVIVGTLGKSAGTSGAFVCGSKNLITYLTSRARSFIYSTSMPPAVAHAGAAAVDILAGYRAERKKFLNGVAEFHDEMKLKGFVTESKSYIIPLVTGSAESALAAEKVFWREGVFIQAIRPPTVPEGSSRLRLTLTLNQTSEERHRVVKILGDHRGLFGQQQGEQGN